MDSMVVLFLTYCLIWMARAEVDNDAESTNHTDPNHDMYVIHATVYQVGILTNRTDNMTDNFNSTGNQESVTLFRTNGNVDLGAISEPLLTNVTAQHIVGVAPMAAAANHTHSMDGWHQLTHPAVLPLENFNMHADDGKPRGFTNKRSLDNFFSRIFKRDVQGSPVNVVNGAAVIPPEVGIQSISLPPLLSLNNNLSQIPVPIPNTSVVHYAKVNTLIQKP